MSLQARRIPQRPLHLCDKDAERQSLRRLSLHPHVAEVPCHREPQQPRQLHVVAHLRMNVQRQMGGVERASGVEQGLHSPAVWPHQQQWPAPEQAMMYDEHVGIGSDGCLNGCLATVHGEGHALHLVRALHLQTVVGDVLNLLDLQGAVQILNQCFPLHCYLPFP